jgi:hypothetical protein
LRFALVALYWICLPFRWYSTGRGFDVQMMTGWEADYALPGLALTVALLFAFLALSPGAGRLRRAVFGVLDSITGLVVLGLFVLNQLLANLNATAPAYYLATSAVIAAEIMALGTLIAWISAYFRRRSISAANILTDVVDPPGSGPRAPEPMRLAERPGADELVLIIHGTGSAADSESGIRWWQVGGSLARDLEQHLPAHVRSHRPGEVFRWSGANRESDRRDAGEALATHLRALFHAWQRIHIVAHSHGGSVAWHAIRELHSAGQLDRIGTVVTLGTPFLRLAPATGLIYASAALLILLLLLMASAPWLIDAVYAGWRIWASLPGFVVALSMAVVVATAISLILFFAHALNWRRRIRRERQTDEAAWGTMKGRLICVWSTHDEAINGLSAAVAAGGGLLMSGARNVRPQRAFWRSPLTTVYEDIVGPILDRALWLRTTRRLQGIDLLGARCEAVLPHPVQRAAGTCLPEELSIGIDDWVEARASTALRKARESLGVFWATGTSLREITSIVSGKLNGNELVHWAYYQAPGLPAMIARLVVRAESLPAADRPAAQSDEISRAREGNRPWSRASAAGLGTLAVVAALIWGLVGSWHRLSVYGLTDRYAVATALTTAPLAAAMEELAIDPLARWSVASANNGSTVPSATDPHGYLHLMKKLDSVPPQPVTLSRPAPKRWSVGACERIYSTVLGREPMVATRRDLAAAYKAGEPKQISTEQIVEPLTDDLAARLRPHLKEYLRSCLRFGSAEAFIVLPARRTFKLIRWPGSPRDAYLAAAVYLAQGWARDSAVTNELRRVAVIPIDQRDSVLRSLTGSERDSLQAAIERTDAFAFPDLVRLMALVEAGTSHEATVRLMRAAIEHDSLAHRALALEIVCELPDSALRAEIRYAVDTSARDGFVEAESRCFVPPGPDPDRDRAGWLDLLKSELAVGLRDSTLFIPRQVLLQAWDLDSSWFGPIRQSRLRCDAAVMLARGGWLRDALDLANTCTFASDRLRGFTAILESFHRLHPTLSFDRVRAEAASMAGPERRR